MNSRRELDEMLDKCHRLQGWDVKTGWPRKATLKNLA